MNVQQAYNVWANNYDTVVNPTRDLEGHALRQILADTNCTKILEIGCGTGKNTEWLLTQTQNLIAADFSEEMLAKAKEKIRDENVVFQQMDMRQKWAFADATFDIITCSLALEHIENIGFVFQEAQRVLKCGGQFYIGELHPFKQYLGSKARFETENGVFVLDCFVHHISDFFKTATENGFNCINIQEWFDEGNPTAVPRILTLLFETQ
jgi:ubiquinone/menaquinone biosynthesis C-methylase UbiE